MKGIVFTEFLEMVEQGFGPEVADQIIVESRVASNGAYTSVGTYNHQELVALVVCLARVSGRSIESLVQAFGEHLFGRFAVGFPQFFKNVGSSFDFLHHVEQYIHPEVLKLYPDAELPRFESKTCGPERMEMIYRSSRQFADLAEGLIRGCAKHFGDRVRIERTTIAEPGGASATVFGITRLAA